MSEVGAHQDVMAALARVVHNREGAADPEHNRRENNQQGGLHGDLATAGPVCTENVVRIDLEGESLNVDHDGRADNSLLELDWLAAQVQERT
jgi:hypothetical protein